MTKEKCEDFMKKHAWHDDHGDHLKQLKPCLYVVQNYRFQFKIVIGRKWTVIKILFVYLSEKAIKLKVIKIPSSFPIA